MTLHNDELLSATTRSHADSLTNGHHLGIQLRDIKHEIHADLPFANIISKSFPGFLTIGQVCVPILHSYCQEDRIYAIFVTHTLR